MKKMLALVEIRTSVTHHAASKDVLPNFFPAPLLREPSYLMSGLVSHGIGSFGSHGGGVVVLKF